MKNHIGCVAAVLALVVIASPAFSQAENLTDVRSAVYRLDEANSWYQYGCQPPCLCPILISENVRGTFNMGSVIHGAAFDMYPITDVNWVVEMWNGDEIRITGDGMYKVAAWTTHDRPMHMLEMNLVVGDEDEQYFFSDLVPMEGGLENIDITISINGIYCFDTVIHIDADRLRPQQITPYTLRTPPSSYQEGCWDPCDCVLHAMLPTTGTFGLVPLRSSNECQRYAVVNVRWGIHEGNNALTPDNVQRERITRVSGYGMYEIGCNAISPDNRRCQRMSLDLTIGNEGTFHFESVRPIDFLSEDARAFTPDSLAAVSDKACRMPRMIREMIATNNLVCYNRVFRLLAYRTNAWITDTEVSAEPIDGNP